MVHHSMLHAVGNTPYTAEENTRLRRLYAEATAGGHAPNWAEIATQFPNRTRHALANQLSTMLKQEKSKGQHLAWLTYQVALD
jgi:hypothetical protein